MTGEKTGMKATTITIPCKPGAWYGVFYCADLHIGSPGFHRRKMVRDFEMCCENGYGIYIFGDLFDGIMPSDRKRSTPSVVVKELQGKNALINASVKYVAEILRPFADNIQMISQGNHEYAIEKYHHQDILGMLHETTGIPTTASIDGWIRHRLRRTNSEGDRSGSHVITTYFHHGWSGNAPVTEGVIDFSRLDCQGADIVALGHNHKANLMDRCYRMLDLQGNEVIKDMKCVRVGGYYAAHGKGEDNSVSYARRAGLRPTPIGGTLIKFCATGQGAKDLIIRVER